MLKHIDTVRAKGREYHYFRHPGAPRVRLPGRPGSPEFMTAYNAAAAAIPQAEREPSWQPQTLAHLAALYYSTARFKAKSERTRYVERKKFDAFMLDFGAIKARSLTTAMLDQLFADMAATPAAAMDLRKRLRNLTRLMIKLGWRTDDPIDATDTFRGGEWHTWTKDEIAQYQAYWPVGTRQRAAFDLALYTGQRRSDLHRMTWQDIAGTAIRVTQYKTGVKLLIPLHPDLQSSLRALPREHVAIIVTEFNRPFSVAGFGNWMADNIRRAGLPSRCVLHGIRKASAAILAEVGCTEKEIAAITGHQSLKEVQRYTKGADQAIMAANAIEKLDRMRTRIPKPTPKL